MAHVNSFCVPALVALAIMIACSQTVTNADKKKIEQSINTDANAKQLNLPDTIDITNLFSLSDAEKILGEPAHLSDSATTKPGVASKHSATDSVLPIKMTAATSRCAYQANAKDQKTGKTGIVYFLIEEYPNVSSAVTVYSYYKRSNQGHPGFKELNNLGNEAWFSDSPLFVYVRKENKIFVMKVNKMTSHTSSDGFNEVVKKIADTF